MPANPGRQEQHGKARLPVLQERRVTRKSNIAGPTIDQVDIGEPDPDPFWIEGWRPATRAECIHGPRPCPWVSCRHHLYIDDDRRGGVVNVRTTVASGDLFDMRQTCSLDIADDLQADGRSLNLEAIGKIMGGISRERVRQIEARAKKRLHRVLQEQYPDVPPEDWNPVRRDTVKPSGDRS